MDNTHNAIASLALETLETLCFLFPVDEDEFTGDLLVALDEHPHALVEFDGYMKGGVMISTEASLMEALVSNMLDEDDITDELRFTALSELTNIICGNVIPILSEGRGVCHMQPPRLATAQEVTGEAFEGYNHETIRLTLDEGLAEIQVFYS
jgi:CheY-specific phosphatase CheX